MKGLSLAMLPSAGYRANGGHRAVSVESRLNGHYRASKVFTPNKLLHTECP